VHIVPQQPQTTLAEYDRRIESSYKGARFAALPSKVPVSHRSFVNPAWEVRIMPERPLAQRGGSGGYVSAFPSANPATAAPAAASAPPAPAVAPPRDEPTRSAQPRRWPGDSDWRDNVFRQW